MKRSFFRRSTTLFNLAAATENEFFTHTHKKNPQTKVIILCLFFFGSCRYDGLNVFLDNLSFFSKKVKITYFKGFSISFFDLFLFLPETKNKNKETGRKKK